MYILKTIRKKGKKYKIIDRVIAMCFFIIMYKWYKNYLNLLILYILKKNISRDFFFISFSIFNFLLIY